MWNYPDQGNWVDYILLGQGLRTCVVRAPNRSSLFPSMTSGLKRGGFLLHRISPSFPSLIKIFFLPTVLFFRPLLSKTDIYLTLKYIKINIFVCTNKSENLYLIF